MHNKYVHMISTSKGTQMYQNLICREIMIWNFIAYLFALIYCIHMQAQKEGRQWGEMKWPKTKYIK